jgi:hypothetical protein
MFRVLILVAVLLTAFGMKLSFAIPNSLAAGAVSGFMGMEYDQAHAHDRAEDSRVRSVSLGWRPDGGWLSMPLHV